MHRSTFLAIPLSCFLSICLTYALIARTDAARTNLTREDGAELRSLRADLNSLNSKLASRRTEQAIEMMKAARHSQDDAITDRVGASDELEVDEAERAASGHNAPLSEAQMRLRMDARFVSESVDTAWRNGAIPVLQHGFAAHLGDGARIADVDCRQSLCRVKTVHGDLRAYNKFSRDMVMAGSNQWHGQALMIVESEPQEGGEVLAVAYMAKPGEDLSAMLEEEP